MNFYITLSKITLLLFFTYSCSQLPGINKKPRNQLGSNKLSNYFTIKDVKIEIIKINNLNESEINNFNDSKLFKFFICFGIVPFKFFNSKSILFKFLNLYVTFNISSVKNPGIVDQ